MLASGLCRVPLASLVSGVRYQAVTAGKTQPCLLIRLQKSSTKAGSRFMRGKKINNQQSFKERMVAPAGNTAFVAGRSALAGASALGVGALCYYGLGLSKEVGTIDTVATWPAEVIQRIRSTYAYFAGSVGLTALSAVAVSRTPFLMNLATKNSFLAIGVSIAAMIGSGMICRSIPYEEGFGIKQLAWMAHSGILGMFVAPLTVLGGPLLIRAAWYTAGVVGGLSAIAICAPSEKFLNMGGPLAMGLGVVFVSNIGSMFLPPTTVLGSGLYSIAMYGGLVLFGMFLLYDTQKIIKNAEKHPLYAVKRYDPINESIGIYLDTLNIFIRIAILLSNGGGRKK